MKHMLRAIMVVGLCGMLLVGMNGGHPVHTAEARGTIWTGYIYSNPDLVGTPYFGPFTTSGLNFNWGTGAPTFTSGLPSDNFSIRFTTSVFFTAGTYLFNVQVNDGARLYVDGAIVVNAWPGSDTEQTVQNNYTFASDAVHSITVEMRETVGAASLVAGWAYNPSGTGGATSCSEGYTYTSCPYGGTSGISAAPVGWPATSGPTAICNDNFNSCSVVASGTCSSHLGVKQWCLTGTGSGGTSTVPAGAGWYGQFFNNDTWTGAPVYTSTFGSGGLQQDWGTGSPGAGVNADNFTARFTRVITVPTDLPEATYLFFMTADEHFRLSVDGTVVMDRTGAPANDYLYALDIPLLSGQHTLVFDYRDISGTASLLLTWDPPAAQSPVIAVPSSPPIQLPEWMTAVLGGQSGVGTITTEGGTVIGGVNATPTISILNVRDMPDLAGTKLTTMSSSKAYPVVGRTADGSWAQVAVGDIMGWASAQYLKFAGDFAAVQVTYTPPAPAEVAAVAAVPVPTGIRGTSQANLRIREQPTTRAKQIGLIPYASGVDLLGRNTSHTWYMVSYEGVTGWAYASWIAIYEGDAANLPYLEGTTGTTITGMPADAPPPTQGVVLQAYGNMRVRTGPGFIYPREGRIPWGSRVQLLSRSADGKWYQVQYNDVIGWSYAIWFGVVEGNLRDVPVVGE